MNKSTAQTWGRLLAGFLFIFALVLFFNPASAQTSWVVAGDFQDDLPVWPAVASGTTPVLKLQWKMATATACFVWLVMACPQAAITIRL